MEPDTIPPPSLACPSVSPVTLVTAIPIVPVQMGWGLGWAPGISTSAAASPLPNGAGSAGHEPAPACAPAALPSSSAEVVSGRMQVRQLLNELNMGQYWELLVENGCDTLGDLVMAPEQLLTCIGLKKMHAAKLTSMVQHYVKPEIHKNQARISGARFLHPPPVQSTNQKRIVGKFHHIGDKGARKNGGRCTSSVNT